MDQTESEFGDRRDHSQSDVRIPPRLEYDNLHGHLCGATCLLLDLSVVRNSVAKTPSAKVETLHVESNSTQSVSDGEKLENAGD